MHLRSHTLPVFIGICLLVTLIASPARAQDLIFADGFESGNTSAWSYAPEQCSNGLDDDDDGFFDCDDFDCLEDPSCIPEICDDFVDNDGDGLFDCDDPECTNDPVCIPEICDNGIDDDGDTFFDCDDFECIGDPACP